MGHYKELELRAALERILFITHNDGVGLIKITGIEDGTNRVVFTPSQMNEIGKLARGALDI
jgi:hypothetical protein|tara:strand:+ start:487 stop:669 length:183 start_codon:yes stop_codon:yes gene_type:complete